MQLSNAHSIFFFRFYFIQSVRCSSFSSYAYSTSTSLHPWSISTTSSLRTHFRKGTINMPFTPLKKGTKGPHDRNMAMRLSGLEKLLHPNTLPPAGIDVLLSMLNVDDMQNLRAVNRHLSRSLLLKDVLKDPHHSILGKRMGTPCQEVMIPWPRWKLGNSRGRMCGNGPHNGYTTRYCQFHPDNRSYAVCETCRRMDPDLNPVDHHYELICSPCRLRIAKERPGEFNTCTCWKAINDDQRMKAAGWSCTDCFDLMPSSLYNMANDRYKQVIEPPSDPARSHWSIPSDPWNDFEHFCAICHTLVFVSDCIGSTVWRRELLLDDDERRMDRVADQSDPSMSFCPACCGIIRPPWARTPEQEDQRTGENHKIFPFWFFDPNYVPLQILDRLIGYLPDWFCNPYMLPDWFSSEY